MRRLLSCVLLVASSTVAAQEFELDLSEDKAKTQPQPEALELDLSEEKPKVPDEFKPSLVVLSVIAGDTDEVSLGRARQLETELLKHLIQSDEFKTVIEPPDAEKQLGAAAVSAKQCRDYACFDTAAKALKVHRAIRMIVTRSGVGSIVSVYAFDPGVEEILEFTYDSGEKVEKAFLGMGGKSQAQKDREFLKKIAPFIKGAVTKLATANGKVEIDNIDNSAAVQVDGAEAGTGSFEVIVQRGPHTVKVAVDGYLPFEKTVSIEPLQTVSVKVSLVAKEIKVTREAPRPQATPFFLRPGMFVAVGGAIFAGIGVGLGQSAAGINKALASGKTPVPVTRADARAGSTQALLANIFVAVGAAAVAGGTTWVLLTPTVAPGPRIEPAESSTVNGAVLEFGGQF